MKAGLESFENQFHENGKRPNFFNHYDTLILTRSGVHRHHSADWVQTSVSHQIFKTDLTQQMMLKFFDIETNQTMIYKLYSDQKVPTLNFIWSVKWLLENTDSG